MDIMVHLSARQSLLLHVPLAELAVVRAHVAAKYVGHDEHRTPVTVLKPGWLVTYAHGAHANWELNTIVPVSVDIKRCAHQPSCQVGMHAWGLSVHHGLTAWQHT